MSSTEVWRQSSEEGVGDSHNDVITGALERERNRLQRELSVARDRLERTASGSGRDKELVHYPIFEHSRDIDPSGSETASDSDVSVTGSEILSRIRSTLKRARKELRPAISNPTVRLSDKIIKSAEHDIGDLRHICDKQEIIISDLSNRLQQEQEEKTSVMNRLKDMISSTGECLNTVRKEASEREAKMKELLEENQMLRNQQYRSVSPSIAAVPVTGLDTVVSRSGLRASQRQKAENELELIRSRISSLQEAIDAQHNKVSPKRGPSANPYTGHYNFPPMAPRFGDGTPHPKKPSAADPFLVP
eukprot:TRINITY_DN6965_c0_g2_i1.p1 TRINITY_DN6965_c0_g2~~TRINITY_DN6965_c0_g2_i1.p1  ORF type:complete len:304 (+),score=57.19 TRINITY_DN6965_c0_g2_i1:62-973(+)